MRNKLLLASVACLLFLAPFQAQADATFTLTAFQSLGPEYASAEIYFTLNNASSSSYYSFCVDNSRTIYQGTPYYAVFSPLTDSNTGLLEAAYLMNTYAPSETGRSNVPGITDITRQGVALQWAIWMVTGQDQVAGVQALFNNPNFADIKIAADQLKLQADTASNLAQNSNSYTQVQIWDSEADYTAGDTAHQQQTLLAPVPLPGTLWFMESGLMGLWGVRRRIPN